MRWQLFRLTGFLPKSKGIDFQIPGSNNKLNVKNYKVLNGRITIELLLILV